MIGCLKVIMQTTDDAGNSIQIVGNDSSIMLRLAKTGKVCNIGRMIYLKEKETMAYYKQEKEEDRFRKTDAWSINYHVLKCLEPRDRIVYETSEASYGLLVKEALKLGKFLHFKTSGIEKKIYVPVKHWRIKKKRK